MQEHPTPNQAPYDTVIILGPDHNGAFKKYLDLCSPQGVGNCIQIGDGTRDVTFDEIREKLSSRIDRHTQIEVFGHGIVEKGKHHVMLMRGEETDLLLGLLDSLTQDPIKCALSSCHGGAICPSLKKGSTVITTAEPDNLAFNSKYGIIKMDERWRQLSPERQVLLAMAETPQTITYYRGLGAGKNLTHVYRPFYNQVPEREETVKDLVQFAQKEFQSRLRENDITYPEASQPIPELRTDAAESLIKRATNLQLNFNYYGDQLGINGGKLRINKENLHVNYQLLRTAINDPKVLEIWLKRDGMNPNFFYGNNEPLLSIAINSRNPESIKILLQNGADPRTLSDKDIIKLFAMSNFRALVADGLIPVNEPLGGKLPLQLAIDSLANVELLLRSGANLNLLPQGDIKKLFKSSIQRGKEYVLDKVAGVMRDQINEPLDGKLPLQWAIETHHFNEDILLKYGASLSLLTSAEATTLFTQAVGYIEYGGADIIKQLVIQKAISTDKAISGKLPFQQVILQVAAKTDSIEPSEMYTYSELLCFFLQNGARLSTLNEAERKTLYDIAAKAQNPELNTLISQAQAAEVAQQAAQVGSSKEPELKQTSNQAATLPAITNVPSLSPNAGQIQSVPLPLSIPDIAVLPPTAAISTLKLSAKPAISFTQALPIVTSPIKFRTATTPVDSLVQRNTNTTNLSADKPSNWKPQEITAKDLVPSITFAPDAALALGMLAGSFQDPIRTKWRAWEEEKFPGTGKPASAEEQDQLLKRMDELWKKQNELDNKHLQPSRKFLLEKSEQFRGNRFMQPFIDKLSWRKKRELDELRDAQFALENFENRLDDRISKGELTVDDIEWANKHLKKIEDQLAELSKKSATQIRSDVSMEQQGQLQKANEAIATAKAKLQEQQDQTKSFGSRLLGFVTGNKAITEQNIARLEKERDELSKGILSTVAVGPKGSRKLKKTSADVILKPDGTPQGLRINKRKTKFGPANPAM